MLQHAAVLKKYFGYDEYRPGQRDLIEHILGGRDVLGIMPTGAGKSLCYQASALLMGGITLVISPLISLMKDQVNALTQAGVKAAYLNSTLTPSQHREALRRAYAGTYKIIYVAPERLASPGFVSFAKAVNISMVTVDEAHCVSQWGQDFRPDYLNIKGFLAQLEKRPVLSAFTATATPQVKADIVGLLGLQQPFEQITGFDRENLYFAVEKPRDKKAFVADYVTERREQSGIIYCATRKAVEELCEKLNDMGIAATRYHAGLDDSERHANQDDFLFDRKRVMVATNAFGMGIDKSNVSYVLHYNMPKNIESYYQEAGRAGRDGQPANCVLLYGGRDVHTNQFLITNSRDSQDDKSVENELELLKRMTWYCTTTDCLRQYMLRYFGDTAPVYCGNCSNCNTHFEEVDITVDAQKIVSCVIRLERRGTPYGIHMLANILKGSKTERLLKLGLDSLSTYGIMEKTSKRRIIDMIEYLSANGWLAQSNDEYSVVRSTDRSMALIKGEHNLAMKLPMETKATGAKQAATGGELYERLRQLRADIAREQGVPAYVVFTDATLRDMCDKLPADNAQFEKVSGVGKAKLDKYAEQFTQEIRDFLAESRQNEQRSVPPGIPEATIAKGFAGQFIPWTQQEDEQLAQEYEQGKKLPEIGKIHKRSPIAIRARLIKLGIILYE